MANEARKTSLGMQAAGVGALVDMGEPRDHPRDRRERREHLLGAAVTLAIHGGLVAIVVVMNVVEKQRPPRPETPYQAIEAGLAIKKKKTEKKSRLPQKDLAPKVKPPDAPKISHNPDAPPPPPDKKKKPDPSPLDAVDAKSVFDKYRRMDTGDVSQDDDSEGSEFGTLVNAKGDPYIGELIGRMTVDFVVPSVVRDQTLVTWGCVKVDEDGKIQDRGIDPEHKAKNPTFNSAVEDRLKATTDMEKPVPNHLKSLLVGKFVCATYTSKRE